MKTTIVGLLFPLLLVSGFAQDFNYSVHAKYIHPVTKDKLSSARSMGDIIPYYPASWISSYNSAEISTNSNGITATAKSSNDIFTEEQIKMLSSLDPGSEIVIDIDYQFEDFVTNKTKTGNMHYPMTVIPDTEAQYSDGNEQLTQYFKVYAIDKISPEDAKDMQQVVVRFTVDEAGEIVNANIFKSSGKPGIDKLLLEVINGMPKWRPASDSHGNKVRQEFEFTLSDGSEGC